LGSKDTEFVKHMAEKVTEYSKDFHENTWVFGTNEGLTSETLHFAELMSASLKMVQKKDKLMSKITTALKVLVEKASFDHQDGQTFFIISQNAGYGVAGDQESLNLSFLAALKELSSADASIHDTIKIKSQKMRNYFLQKSQISTDLRQTYFAMRGLKMLSETYPFLTLSSNKVVNFSDRHEVKFQLKNMIGVNASFKEAPAKINITEKPYNGDKDKKIDVTSHVEVDKKTGLLKVPINKLSIGRYYL